MEPAGDSRLSLWATLRSRVVPNAALFCGRIAPSLESPTSKTPDLRPTLGTVTFPCGPPGSGCVLSPMQYCLDHLHPVHQQTCQEQGPETFPTPVGHGNGARHRLEVRWHHVDSLGWGSFLAELPCICLERHKIEHEVGNKLCEVVIHLCMAHDEGAKST
jgi:hypothetical protein